MLPHDPIMLLSYGIPSCATVMPHCMLSETVSRRTGRRFVRRLQRSAMSTAVNRTALYKRHMRIF